MVITVHPQRLVIDFHYHHHHHHLACMTLHPFTAPISPPLSTSSLPLLLPPPLFYLNFFQEIKMGGGVK